MPSDEPRFEKRPEDRPRELMAAALETFAETGYRPARLEEIAARAGVSKGTIYLYFKNKEDLLLQSLEYHMEVARANVLARIEQQGGTSSTRLRAALRLLWETALQPEWGRVYRLMTGEIAAEHPAIFRTWAETGAIPIWKLLAEIVEEGQSSGAFRADISATETVRVFATGLVHQVYLETHTVIGELAPSDADQLLESTVRVFLRGLQSPQAPESQSLTEPSDCLLNGQ